MKVSLRFLTTAGMAMILFLHLTVSSQAAAPVLKEGFSSTDKPGGRWYSDDIQTPSDVSHQGKHVSIIINNVLYEQTFQGDFVDPTTIQGKLTRRKRIDQTTTILQMTLVFTSSTFIRMYWTALDSNSDLHMGQSGVSEIKWLPDPKPIVAQPPVAPPPPAKTYDPMAHID